MAYPGLMDDVRNCLRLGKPARLPVFLASTTPFDLRWMGLTHDDIATSAETLVEVHCRAVEEFDYDWVFLHVDSCVVLEPLGIEGGPKGTRHTEPWTPRTHLPATRQTLRSLDLPDPHTDGRMVLVLKAARAIKDRFGDSICLGGHVTAPFSSLAYLNGTTEAMTLLYDDPALAQESLEFLLALQLRFALAQLDAGADAIWIGDLNSSSHVISPQHYSDFAYPYVERLVRGIREAGGISFYHQNEPRTHRIAMTAGLMQPGTGGINVGQGADIYAVRNAIGSRVCLLGGLDPWELLRGTPSSLRAQTAELIERIGVFGGYILNTGGQVHVETPEENVRAVIRAARELWEGTEARLAQ